MHNLIEKLIQLPLTMVGFFKQLFGRLITNTNPDSTSQLQSVMLFLGGWVALGIVTFLVNKFMRFWRKRT